QRWEDRRQLRPYVFVEGVEPSRIEPLNVVVDRVDEHPERQVALELGRAPRENDVAARVRPRGEFGEEAGLANARLADQFKRCGLPPVQVIEEIVERAELLGAADEVLGKCHALLAGP